MPPLPPLTTGTLVRSVGIATAVARVARGARRKRPLQPGGPASPADVTVLVPARDEEGRIGPCLESLAGEGAPVIVVDDGSTDGTAELARRAGATVVDAGPLPEGWAGKAHALHVGLERVDTPVVVAVDADCRVHPGFVSAMVDALRGHALVSAGARVDEPDAGGRAVHASMLTTLLYRLGPPGVPAHGAARVMANGQAMALDRAAVLSHGGFAPVAGNLLEDLALARHLAGLGESVAFLDGTAIVDVVGYGAGLETLRGWGRSLSLAEVTSRPWLAADLTVLWVAMGLPVLRVLRRRADALDVVALALRAGAAVATAGAFRRRGPALALAPLADPVVVAWLTASAVRPSRRWRGRDYR